MADGLVVVAVVVLMFRDITGAVINPALAFGLYISGLLHIARTQTDEEDDDNTHVKTQTCILLAYCSGEVIGGLIAGLVMLAWRRQRR